MVQKIHKGLFVLIDQSRVSNDQHDFKAQWSPIFSTRSGSGSVPCCSCLYNLIFVERMILLPTSLDVNSLILVISCNEEVQSHKTTLSSSFTTWHVVNV